MAYMLGDNPNSGRSRPSLSSRIGFSIPDGSGAGHDTFGQSDSVEITVSTCKGKDVGIKEADDNRLTHGDLAFTLNARPRGITDNTIPPTFRPEDEYDAGAHAGAVVSIQCLNRLIRDAALRDITSHAGNTNVAGSPWYTNPFVVAEWAQPLGIVQGKGLDASMQEVAGEYTSYDTLSLVSGGRIDATNGPVSIHNAGHSYNKMICGQGSVLYVQFSRETIQLVDMGDYVPIVIVTLVVADDPRGRAAVGSVASLTDLDGNPMDPVDATLDVCRGQDQPLRLCQVERGTYGMTAESALRWMDTPLAHPTLRILTSYGIVQETINTSYKSDAAFCNFLYARGTPGCKKQMQPMSISYGDYGH